MGWLYPQNLLFVLLLLPAAFLLWLLYRRSARLLPSYFGVKNVRMYNPVLKNGLRALGLALLLLATAGWYAGTDTGEQPVLGRQVYFLVDVSASMNVKDLTPNRLEKVKKELHRVAQALKGEQIGLVVFTNYAYMQCPLTSDAAAFEMYLDVLETSQFANAGTDFRTALAHVADRFEHALPVLNDKGEAIDPRNIARAIVLVSDGEDFGKKNASVLTRLVEQGVQVMCVGVGTTTGGNVPGDAERGEDYKRTQTGDIAISKRVDDKLIEIGKFFSTPYFVLDGPATTLNPLITELQTMPASRIATRQDKIRADRFQWFVLLGMGCILASMVLLPAGADTLGRGKKRLQPGTQTARTPKQEPETVNSPIA
jgi:Ca-activated chloride channel family protein